MNLKELKNNWNPDYSYYWKAIPKSDSTTSRNYTDNPKLFTLSFSVRLNGDLMPMIFVTDLLSSEISEAIDLIYAEVEEKIKAMKLEYKQNNLANSYNFIEANVRCGIARQEN
jgi:hypothetical protein